MPQAHNTGRIQDEDRRDLLKTLGIVGTVAVGSATLSDLQSVTSPTESEELAPVGQAIQSEMGGAIDSDLIATQQAELRSAAADLDTVVERGFPTEGPRHEFGPIAEAGRPIYDHLGDVGFFESTTEILPHFNSQFLQNTIATFASSEPLTTTLEETGVNEGAGVDLLAEVVVNSEALRQKHWVATDSITREEVEIGEYIPPMTMGAAGGALLWLEDLDKHLWQKRVILSDQILTDAVWHGKSMAAGFYLMSEGARIIGAEEAMLSESELGALLSTGFAVQAISQGLLPQDVYWVTEEMRDWDSSEFMIEHIEQ